MQLNLLKANQFNKYLLINDKKNIMVYYPLHLELVKQLLQKKFNKNIKHLKFQFHTQQENQDLMKLMA